MRELVPIQCPCGLFPWHAGAMLVPAVQDLQQRAADQLRVLVGLHEPARTDPRAEARHAAVQHGRDDLYRSWPQYFSRWQSAILPSEEFFRVTEGFDGGWPYYYYDWMQRKKLLNPEYGGDGKKEGDGAKLTPPLVGFPGHFAPNDLLFYQGTQFPGRYRNGAFIAFHGSWNRAPEPQAGYNVVFQPMKDGKPNGKWEVFADGFAGQSATELTPRNAVHRPVGLAVAPDGSLFVTDSQKGRIWRISYSAN